MPIWMPCCAEHRCAWSQALFAPGYWLYRVIGAENTIALEAALDLTNLLHKNQVNADHARWVAKGQLRHHDPFLLCKCAAAAAPVCCTRNSSHCMRSCSFVLQWLWTTILASSTAVALGATAAVGKKVSGAARRRA